MSVQRFAHLLLLLLTLVTTFFVYERGLYGTFVLDDFHNIANNPRLAIADLKLDTLKQAAYSTTIGPVGRPVSMLSFAANCYFTGFQPFYFKITNLVVHLFNGLGVFLLTSLILDAYRRRFQPDLTLAHASWISVAVTAAWLLHPFNLTSVLYVVQRMTSLSALFSVWGLALFLWGRIRLYDGKSGITAILASVFLFTPLAALSKETGVLLPIFMFIIEATLFNFHAQKESAHRFLIGFYIFTVALPVTAVLGYITIHPEWILDGYKIRDFTLSERLMTQGRVIWSYIRQILLPSNTQMGLFHDDIAISRSLLHPISTVLSLVGVLALVAIAFIVRRKRPLVSLGLFLFMAGHIVESTVVPLELAYEHRNYLPMYGILLVLFFYGLYPLKHANTLRLRQAVGVLLVSLFAFSTYSRASHWANPFDLGLAEVENHPNSLRANAEMGNMLSSLTSTDVRTMEAYYLSGRHYYENMGRIDSNDIHGLIGLILLNASRGKAAEPSWLPALKSRLDHAPIPVNIGNKLEGLIACQMSGGCKFGNAELEELFKTTLRNPNLTPLKRAAVLSALGMYQANVAEDYPAALAAMRQTVDAAPWVVEYRLTLVSFLSVLNHFPEAKEQLAMIKQFDKLQLHTARIEEQEKLLSSQNN